MMLDPTSGYPISGPRPGPEPAPLFDSAVSVVDLDLPNGVAWVMTDGTPQGTVVCRDDEPETGPNGDYVVGCLK